MSCDSLSPLWEKEIDVVQYNGISYLGGGDRP